jgi:CubicO group peptidase (beta-lactamase class C family)
MPIERDELDGYLGGSGGVISTAEDLANYLIAHNNGGNFNGLHVLSLGSVAVLHHPPPDVDSSYAMGWTLDDDSDGPTIIQHSGVLSAYHADVALLPQDNYGIALLYSYNHALANCAGIRNGIVALLLGEAPEGTGPGAATTGLIMAGLILLTLALLYLALRRAPGWARKRSGWPWWRVLPGIAWTLLPTWLVIGLPELIQLFADRVFTHHQILLSMPEVYLWLMITAVLSILVGVVRILTLKRERAS